MKASIPIGIQPGTRILRLYREPALGTHLYIPNAIVRGEHGYWILWIFHNADLTLGTFLKLHDDGRIDRVTQHENGTETIVEVKGADT